MLADHAEDCLNDVASCLQQNNSSSYYYSSTSTYEDISDVAINACKSQIKTCMSTMGETIPTNNTDIKNWLEDALSAKTSPITQIKFEFNGWASGLTEGFPEYFVEGFEYSLPSNSDMEDLDSVVTGTGQLKFCWKSTATYAFDGYWCTTASKLSATMQENIITESQGIIYVSHVAVPDVSCTSVGGTYVAPLCIKSK